MLWLLARANFAISDAMNMVRPLAHGRHQSRPNGTLTDACSYSWSSRSTAPPDQRQGHDQSIRPRLRIMLMISGDVLCHRSGGQFCTTSRRGKVGAIVPDDAGAP